jgi:MacB-like periplasmic core domain
MTAQSAVPRPCDLTDRDPMRLTCSYVHQNFLPTLGIRPVVGSNFTTDDMLPDAPLTVMLSYELWKSRYNEQPSIVNQVIEIDSGKAQVKAVLPQDFEMPSAQPTDLLLPKQVDVSAVRAGSVPETCEFSLASSPELQQLKPMPLCSHYLSKASDPLPLKCAAISTSWCALCAIVKCTTCSP